MRFEQKEDCYLDTKTGLEWSLESYGPMPWGEIPGLCRSLGKGWRCPTMEELATLLNYSSCDPATRLPQMRSDFYWSSSTYTSYPYYAWYVHFGNGNVFGKAKTYDYYVRLVRGERRAVTGKTTA